MDTQRVIWSSASLYVIDPMSSPWYYGITDGADYGATMALERFTDATCRDDYYLMKHDVVSSLSDTEGRALVTKLVLRSVGSTGFVGDHQPALCVCKSNEMSLQKMIQQQSRLLASFKQPCEVDILQVSLDISATVRILPGQKSVDSEVRTQNEKAILAHEIGGVGMADNSGEIYEVYLSDIESIRRISTGQRLCLMWNGRKIHSVYEKRPYEFLANAS